MIVGEPDAARRVQDAVTPRHLYIHVPFCKRRCSYCDFAVEAVKTPPVDAWLEATLAELELVAHAEGWDGGTLDTLYIGGGTPSVLGPGAMARLLEGLERRFALDSTAEWTVEANPESFDAALARDWVVAGVNRVSLGAQSFQEAALRWMGRLHGPDGPGRAVAAARSAGLDNVSVDLIFALPDTLERDWDDDLDRALALEPDHVSLYGLTAEPGAPLGRWVRQGRARLPDEAGYGAEYLRAVERLTEVGFEHYEVSNFALPGRASRHNQAYWNGAAYLGLGVGAHSYVAPRRWWNTRDWAAYRDAVRAGNRPLDDMELVDSRTEALERIWLGLRTRDGLPLARLDGPQRRLVEHWTDQGWAALDRSRVRLSGSGWLLLDRLAVELDARGSA